MNRRLPESLRRGLHAAGQRLLHAARARYWRGFGVHSPFVYHLVRHIITAPADDAELMQRARRYRSELLRDTSTLRLTDLGTGTTGRTVSIGTIARRAAVGEKYGLMLARLVREFQPDNILELGTSLGMSTLYMAAARPASRVCTVEGSPECAQVARRMLDKYHIDNVELIVADFDDVIDTLLRRHQPRMVYIDGNHTEAATLRYVGRCLDMLRPLTIIVLDDIHWSPGMTRAWRTIVGDPRVQTTLETSHAGLAILRRGCPKEHYRLRW